MGISRNLYTFSLNVTDDVPSSDYLLDLHDSYKRCFFFFIICSFIPYFLICPFGVFEVNTGRMRPSSPSFSTSKIPCWRAGVEVSILKNNHVFF